MRRLVFIAHFLCSVRSGPGLEYSSFPHLHPSNPPAQPLRHLPQPFPADRPVDGRDAEDSSSSSETRDEDEDSDGQSDSSERKTRFLAGLPMDVVRTDSSMRRHLTFDGLS